MTTVEQESREHRFGSSPTLSLGVEEELLLVDGARRLRPAAEDVIEAVGPEMKGWVSTEIFATQIELKTGICADSDQALSELARLRRIVAERGFEMIAAGIHPDDPEE